MKNVKSTAILLVVGIVMALSGLVDMHCGNILSGAAVLFLGVGIFTMGALDESRNNGVNFL